MIAAVQAAVERACKRAPSLLVLDDAHVCVPSPAAQSGPGEVGVGQPKRILFVGFDTGEEEQQKRKLEAWVKKMGTVMDPKRVGAAKECTHIVMPRIKTSSKFLAAIARGGVPVLAPCWIKECERQQRAKRGAAQRLWRARLRCYACDLLIE